MLTRILATAGATALLFTASPALAADVTTTTHTHQGVVRSFVDVVPSCQGGGPKYNITTTSNSVAHRTLFADGRRHITFTSTGTFVAAPRDDASLPNYTGKFTQWFGYNVNGKVVAGTDTFSVRGTGSDGSGFQMHSSHHFNLRPDLSVHELFHCH